MSTAIAFNGNILNPNFVGMDLIRATVRQTNAAIADTSIVGHVGYLFRKAAGALKRTIPIEAVSISDNGHTGTPYQPVADIAEDEIRGRLNTIQRAYEVLKGVRTNISIRYANIASQDTLGGAAHLYQTVVGELPIFGRFVFLNVAPRKAERGKSNGNGGESIYIAVHKNGTVFGGTGPDCFSFFKDEVKNGELVIFKANVETKVSQFRSRDFFTWFTHIGAQHLHKARKYAGQELGIKQQKDILGLFNFVDQSQVLTADHIPDIPNDRAVATSVDVHGNLKTALRGQDVDAAYPKGGRVYIFAKGKLVEAFIKDQSFDGAEGKVAVSRGSTYRDPQDLADSTPAAIELFKVGKRIADDLKVTAADLRNGLEFHVIDANLLDASVGITPEKPGEYGKYKAREREILRSTAETLVATGLVKGLDNSRLRTAQDLKILQAATGPHRMTYTNGKGGEAVVALAPGQGLQRLTAEGNA